MGAPVDPDDDGDLDWEGEYADYLDNWHKQGESYWAYITMPARPKARA